MTDAIHEQQAAIKLGEQVLGFLNGPIGQYIAKKAESEERAALEGLANVDPDDPKAIRALQNDVYRAQMVMEWLAEAVKEALAAKEAMGEREELPESTVQPGGAP